MSLSERRSGPSSGPIGNPVSQSISDFRVEFSRGSGWQATAISPRAKDWVRRTMARGGFFPATDERDAVVVRTDLSGINELVERARREGYLSEYVGPHEVVRL